MNPLLLIAGVLLMTNLTVVDAAANSLGLDGSQWLLQTLNGQPEQPGAMPLAFAPEHFSGSDGCNRIFGAYKQPAEGQLLIDHEHINSTLMACPEKVSRFASAYLEMLGKIRQYQLTETELKLQDQAGQVLAVYNRQPLALTGIVWKIRGLNNGRGGVEFSSTRDLERQEVAFENNGQLMGKMGCHSFSGTYQADAAALSIQFSGLQSLPQTCARDAGDEDVRLLFKALENSVSYHRTGPTLELRSADGALQVSLTQGSP